MALGSGLGCIAGISAMSDQGTSRMSTYLAQGGVAMGLACTLGERPMHAATPYGQS